MLKFGMMNSEHFFLESSCYLTRSFRFLSNIRSRLPLTFCRAMMIAGPALKVNKYLTCRVWAENARLAQMQTYGNTGNSAFHCSQWDARYITRWARQVREKCCTLLCVSKSVEECGRHWRCQVTLVAAAAESCRSRQVVEKAPGRPLLFWHIQLLRSCSRGLGP